MWKLVLYLVIGVAAGWLAGRIMKGSGFGLIGDLVVGVIGAVLGGWLFGLLNISFGGIVGNLAVALIGAVVFLWLARLLLVWLIKKG